MNYLIILLALMPGYLWHICYVRNSADLTLPYSAWKLLLPLLFVSLSFLTLTFFLLEYDLYPACLAFLSEEYTFKLGAFQCTGEAAKNSILNFCNDIEILKLFANSILLILALSAIFWVIDFLTIIIEDWMRLLIKNLRRLTPVIDRRGKGKFFAPFVFQLLLFRILDIIYRFILSPPWDIVSYIMRHIYLLDKREENEFLMNATEETVLVTLKSNRVYVGTLIEADLRQSSDDDDALVLGLLLSGYRDMESGVLKYKTSYGSYSPEKLVFMREIESVSIYSSREDVTSMFVGQKSVEYPWDSENVVEGGSV